MIDVFAARNIPIKNMDRASGFISTDPLGVELRDASQWADCGKVYNVPRLPDRATYNVLARGDSARSTVKVTARWTEGGVGDAPLIECSTKHVWEQQLETEIKARAEGRYSEQTASPSAVPCSENDRTKAGGGDIAAWVSIPQDDGRCSPPKRCVYREQAAFMSKTDAIAKCRSDAFKDAEKEKRKKGT